LHRTLGANAIDSYLVLTPIVQWTRQRRSALPQTLRRGARSDTGSESSRIGESAAGTTWGSIVVNASDCATRSLRCRRTPGPRSPQHGEACGSAQGRRFTSPLIKLLILTRDSSPPIAGQRLAVDWSSPPQFLDTTRLGGQDSRSSLVPHDHGRHCGDITHSTEARA
jgi:hypothetical protein